MANLINRGFGNMGGNIPQMSNNMPNGNLANNPAIQQIKQMMGMLNGVQNPQAILQQVAQQNPQLAQVMQMCQGKNPQEVFYQMCNQRGINPDEILNALKS